MIERIKNALARCGIALWRINERAEETAELFFVKRQLDTRRSKDVRKYEVTVFRDVENPDGGKPSRGFTSVTLTASMDDAKLDEELKRNLRTMCLAGGLHGRRADRAGTEGRVLLRPICGQSLF